MEKQAACAAAISSSGLVASGLSSARFGQLTFCSPSVLLVVERIVPLPSIRLPFHVTSARRSVAISRSPSVVFGQAKPTFFDFRDEVVTVPRTGDCHRFRAMPPLRHDFDALGLGRSALLEL